MCTCSAPAPPDQLRSANQVPRLLLLVMVNSRSPLGGGFTVTSTVVLPASMTEPLGFDPDDLEDGWSQTANGKVAVRRGTLDIVRVGTMEVEDVAVSFIADEQLRGLSLLGMSFLGRFRVVIDDDNNQIILMSK